MSGQIWIPPVDWSGTNAVLYYNFDSSDGFVLMEATQEMGPVQTLTGQVIWTKVEKTMEHCLIFCSMFDGFQQ